jgi:hypothetical protein
MPEPVEGRWFWRAGEWPALLLLLLFAWRIRHASGMMSDTFDEIIHILHGVLYWLHTPLYPVVENPPLVNGLIGRIVTALHNPVLPVTDPVWETGNWLRISQRFAWELNDNGHRLVHTARMAILWPALLTGAVVYVWGRALYGARRAGLLALFLFSMDPNVLAHSGLATTDAGTMFFFCLAAWLLWRYWHRPGWGRFLVAGVGMGLALAAKFSAVVLWPGVVLAVLYQVVAGVTAGSVWRRIGRASAEICGWLLIAVCVFLTVYRFDLAALSADFAHQSRHFAEGHSSYLLGQTGRTGWWYYFPVVFLSKTPLPFLLLLAAALLAAARESVLQRWSGLRLDLALWPLLLVGGIGAASLFSRVNLGYRYLLPALPLLWLFAARLALPVSGRWGRYRPIATWILALSAALSVAGSHPHYLAWFNPLAGGPDRGWRIAVDSNMDWGQDVGRLAHYMDVHDIPFVHASWLGSAPPEAYHIRGRLLPVWPAAQRDRLYDPFYPPRPAPGFYALSATQLTGVYLDDVDEFAWFRERSPTAKAGYSLFLYDVPPDGPSVQVALGGVAVSDILPEAYARFGSNDVHLRWFDPWQAVLWPRAEEGGEVWAVVGDGHLPLPTGLEGIWPAPQAALCGKGRGGRGYCFVRLGGEVPGVAWQTRLEWQPVSAESPVALTAPALFGNTFTLTGWQLVSDSADDTTVLLLTEWQVHAPPTGNPYIFLHLVDSAGAIASQHDGLGVQLQGLRPGDRFVQRHELPRPADWHRQPYRFRIGVYDRTTGARYPVLATADQLIDQLWLQTQPDPP